MPGTAVNTQSHAVLVEIFLQASGPETLARASMRSEHCYPFPAKVISPQRASAFACHTRIISGM
jgi:hypothetical protein